MSNRRLVVISDFQDGPNDGLPILSVDTFREQWSSGSREAPVPVARQAHDVVVEGGYIERLPLACLKAKLIDSIEIWTHWRGSFPPKDRLTDNGSIVRRCFQMSNAGAPISSNDMLGHINVFGAPDILCVWGLGVSEEIMQACESSFKIYNSIDAPALRIPSEISRHFNVVLTGAQWQSDAVHQRHPCMRTAILPIGPEFASDTMFYPMSGEKPYDLIYVAAAQAYKRHDILFAALNELPRSIRALCVFGYGELGDMLRCQATEMGLNIDFIGPPGVPFGEVNRLMNKAKIGVVCGVDDGAPAILTEYMLAGLPVLANSALLCGLQYITPKTGRATSAEQFPQTILQMLRDLSVFSPREQVIAHWTWPHSVEKLMSLLAG